MSLNLPADARLVDTRYQDVLAAGRPRIVRPGAVIDVVSGTVDGVTGPAPNHWPVQGVIVTLEPGARLALPMPACDRAFALVLHGTVTVAGRRVNAGQVAWSEPTTGPDSALDLHAASDTEEPARIMVYSGRPIGSPIVMGGSFVMNHAHEIEQARRDYLTGSFGPVPRLARL